MDFDVISPKTSQELLSVISEKQNKNIRFGAGYTDLINDLNNNPQDNLTVINLAQLNDESFRSITIDENGIRLGALVTASQILKDSFIKANFPVFWEATNSVASMQIRHTATIGGNICQASPSGDMSCALVALDANCEIIDSSGKIRITGLADFFTGVKKTSLLKNEVLRSIFVPANMTQKIKSGYIKVGTRLSMEIAIASLAYHFQMDKENVVIKAGFSIGAMAPVIKFAEEACNFLTGKNIEIITPDEVSKFASLVCQYASPISDVRASEWYRSNVLVNSAMAIFHQYERE